MGVTISSSWTFFYKYILCIYAIFIVSIVLFFGLFFGDMTSIGLCIGFAPVGIVILVCLIKFWWMPLKRISIDTKYLYISNYFRTIKVPYSQIMDITENQWYNPHLVWIHLYKTTDFGDKIMFMAELNFTNYKHHPIVQELKDFKKRS